MYEDHTKNPCLTNITENFWAQHYAFLTLITRYIIEPLLRMNIIRKIRTWYNFHLALIIFTFLVQTVSGTKVILGFVHSLYIFIIFYFIINISNLLFNSQKRETRKYK